MKISMKVPVMCALLLAAVGFKGFTQNLLTIPVGKEFRLNPILGINGSASDPDSRFVQRMIFSTLVIPATDPVIDIDFVYDTSVSMIREVHYADRRGQFVKVYDMDNPDPDLSSSRFQVVLRNNMYFMIGNGSNISRDDKVTAEDVVFSYRLAQTSLKILNDKKEADNYTNAILSAQLADLETVNYIEDFKVEFSFKNSRKIRDFINFLVYTPIVSVKQLTGNDDKTPQRTEYSFRQGAPETSAYDMRRLNPVRLKKFESQPASYGQYAVERTTNPTINEMPYTYKEVTIRKNQDWQPVNLRFSMVLNGGGLPAHNNYQNGNDRILIKTESADIKDIFRKQLLLVNHPLTVDSYLRNQTKFDERIGIGIEDNNYLRAQRMFISYRLFGLIYSPQSPMFNETDIRKFIKDSIDRNMIVRSMKDDSSTLTANTKAKDLLLSKIVAFPLYYPFYAGKEDPAYDIENKPENLDQLQSYYRQTDLSYTTNPNLNDQFNQYQMQSTDRQNDLLKYFRGEYWPEYLKELEEKFTRLQNEIQIEEKMKASDGNIRIRILYDNEDAISVKIYNMLTNNLRNLFRHLNSNGTCRAQLILAPVRLQGRTFETVPPEEYDLIIYGWNYRFDFLGELRPFFKYNPAVPRLTRAYDIFLRTISRVSVSNQMFNIAKEITDNELITTLIGIQNYLLFDSERVPMSSLDKLGPYIIMYPYYWRTNEELRK
jgi:hypothetical protein